MNRKKRVALAVLAAVLIIMAVWIIVEAVILPQQREKTAEENPVTGTIQTSEDYRPRTIVTTDGECDDLNSFVHFLLCSNNMDVRGIVLTSSIYHYAGNETENIEPYRWAGEDWLDTYLDAYEKVYTSLASHDVHYPTAEQLRSVTKIGNIASAGDMEKETEGSNLIRNEILAQDDSRLYLQCWGGSNTVARALLSIEEEFGTDEDWPEIKEQISRKLVIYLVSTQDDTYEDYISVDWPDITILHNTKSFEAMAFNWRRVLAPSQYETMEAEWQIDHILHQQNPLLQLYYTYDDEKQYAGELEQYQYGLSAFNIQKFWRELTYHGGFFEYGDFLSEGDSPAFLFLLDDSLAQAEETGDYAVDNWGGSFHKISEHYYVDDSTGASSIGRYITDINEDFARRVSWSE